MTINETYTLSLHDALPIFEEGVMQAVKQTFNPEFINRLDEIIVFEPLTDTDLFEIIGLLVAQLNRTLIDRKSTRLNSSHSQISYAVFCLKKKNQSEHYTSS